MPIRHENRLFVSGARYQRPIPRLLCAGNSPVDEHHNLLFETLFISGGRKDNLISTSISDMSARRVDPAYLQKYGRDGPRYLRHGDHYPVWRCAEGGKVWGVPRHHKRLANHMGSWGEVGARRRPSGVDLTIRFWPDP